VDPGGNGVAMNVGGERGPGLPGRREDEHIVPSSGDRYTHRMLEDKEDGLGATSKLRHEQSMYYCMC
jgi:hypothetical protein